MGDGLLSEIWACVSSSDYIPKSLRQRSDSTIGCNGAAVASPEAVIKINDAFICVIYSDIGFYKYIQLSI